MVMLCLFTSSHMSLDSTQKPASIVWQRLGWIARVAAGRSYVWQQDTVLCHTSRRTLFQLSENFYDHITPNIWLPYSPDYNPPDNFVWSMVEQETNKILCNTKDELKATIMAAFSNSNKDTIGKICWRFQCLLEVMVKANVNFFEEI